MNSRSKTALSVVWRAIVAVLIATAVFYISRWNEIAAAGLFGTSVHGQRLDFNRGSLLFAQVLLPLIATVPRRPIHLIGGVVGLAWLAFLDLSFELQSAVGEVSASRSIATSGVFVLAAILASLTLMWRNSATRLDTAWGLAVGFGVAGAVWSIFQGWWPLLGFVPYGLYFLASPRGRHLVGWSTLVALLVGTSIAVGLELIQALAR